MRNYYKYKMNLMVGNILSIVFFLLALIPLYFLKDCISLDCTLKELGIFFIIYFFWMFLHELLHGIGHLLCGVKRKDLSFGASIEKGVLFCLVRREVNKKGILISLLFPFFFIGVLTYIIGIIITIWLFFFFFWFLIFVH